MRPNRLHLLMLAAVLLYFQPGYPESEWTGHGSAPFADRNTVTIDVGATDVPQGAFDGAFDGLSPEIKAALKENEDAAYSFRTLYDKPDYAYAQYLWKDIQVVREDIKLIQEEEDQSKFLVISEKLKEDFGVLDAEDDTLRVSDVL